jgi:putative ABC transport system permease protein
VSGPGSRLRGATTYRVTVNGVRLLLRGLWFRRGASLAVLVVTTLVVAGAVTGPLFLRAAGESVLRDSLSQSLPAGRTMYDRVKAPLSARPAALAQAVSTRKLEAHPTLNRLLGPPVASVEVPSDMGAVGASANPVTLVYRDGVCAHVRMVAGRCAEQAGVVMVSVSSAELTGWTTSSRLKVGGQPVVVSGTYVPLEPTGDFWAGHAYFAAYSGSGRAGGSRNSLDAVFASLDTVQSQPGDDLVTGAVDRGLDAQRIRLTDIPALQQELLSYIDAEPVEGLTAGGGDLSDSALLSVLTDATTVIAKVRLPVLVVETQLLVLCWLILFMVVANASEARGPEVALAKLRGLPAAATVAFGLLDTVALIVVALPFGFVLAWAGVSVLTRFQLAPDTPVVVTAAAGWAALAAGGGAVMAAVLAGSQTLRRPVVEQWRRATRRVRARSWAVDVLVVGAAVVGLVALVRSGAVGTQAPNPLALVAPGLVVLAAALLGSRLLPWACRLAFVPTRRRGRVAAMLAVRQLGRRPVTLRLALVLAVAFGLVTFAIDASSVTRANAHDRGWTEVGAAAVLTVVPPPGQDLADLVDRLDPSGREAATVSTLTDYRGAPTQLLAVEPDRFAHVAFWRPDFGAARLSELTDRLRVPVAPSVLVSGDAMEVSVAATWASGTRPPVLVADIDASGTFARMTPVSLGVVPAGRSVLRVKLPCQTQPCRLAGFHLVRAGAELSPIRGQLQMTSLAARQRSGWTAVPGDPLATTSWRSAGDGGGAMVRADPGRLRLTIRAEPTDSPAWQVADYPTSLPALMTAPALDERGPTISGLSGANIPLTPIAVGPALPGSVSRGVVVDRAYALRASGGAVTAGAETVWLAPAAVATFPRELEQSGATIVSTLSATELTTIYQRQGPALAILLFLVSAALGAVLAAGGAVLTLHLSGRRRTYELAAMATLGVRRRVLLASLGLEQGLLVVFGIAVGGVAGVVGALIALPSVPEFSDIPASPPQLYGIHPVAVLGSLGAALLVLAVVVALSSNSLVRAARFDQLREAPA